MLIIFCYKTNLSLRKPLHWLPKGSHIVMFARQDSFQLQHFRSSMEDTAVGAAISLSGFSSTVNFLSELKTSWLNTKYNYHHLAQPGSAVWDPLAQYSGN